MFYKPVELRFSYEILNLCKNIYNYLHIILSNKILTLLLSGTHISVITALKTDIVLNYTWNFIFFVTENTNRVN